MNIEQFFKKYKKKQNQKISEIVNKWQINDSVNKFLGLTVAPSIVIMDILIGNEFIDFTPNPLTIEAMKIAKGSFQTSTEIKNHLIEQLLKGNKSVQGAVNRLQGYAGEAQFKNLSNGTISLAETPNQKVVDAMRETDNGKEFIQIKIYKEPNKVIEKIKEANEQINNKSIFWKNSEGIDDIPITEPPTFVVNEDIYQAVKEKVSNLGLPNKIESMGVTRENIQEGSIVSDFTEIKSEFFSSCLSPIVLSVGIQAFFQWYHHRNLKNILDNLPKNLLISSSGVAGALLGRRLSKALIAELELAALFPPGGMALVCGVAIAHFARGFTTRITERIDTSNKIESQNKILEDKLKKIMCL